MFKKGDKVRYKNSSKDNGKEGVVIEVINKLFVEVEYDGDTYYWHQSNLELIRDDLDDWDPDFGFYASQTNFNFGEREVKCTCDSWTLFHFGCKCGAFQKEQDEKQRGSRGGDLDREN